MNSLTHPHYHFISLPCKGMKPSALKSYMLRIAFLSSCANPKFDAPDWSLALCVYLFETTVTILGNYGNPSIGYFVHYVQNLSFCQAWCSRLASFQRENQLLSPDFSVQELGFPWAWLKLPLRAWACFWASCASFPNLEKTIFLGVISLGGGFSSRMIKIAYRDPRLVFCALWTLFSN